MLVAKEDMCLLPARTFLRSQGGRVFLPDKDILTANLLKLSLMICFLGSETCLLTSLPRCLPRSCVLRVSTSGAVSVSAAHARCELHTSKRLFGHATSSVVLSPVLLPCLAPVPR